MKRYTRMIVVLLTLALLLSACTATGQTPTEPVSDTTPPTTATQPTEPTPTTPTGPTEPTDWLVTQRQVLPFEQRFAQDVVFGNQFEWVVPKGDAYVLYKFTKEDFGRGPYIVEGSDGSVYHIPYTKDLTGYSSLIADGQSVYWWNDREIMVMDLVTGDCRTYMAFGKDVHRLYIQACGKDTLLILTVTGESKALRIFYKDLRSDAEKTMYEGNVLNTPLNHLAVGQPISALSPISISMINPDFYIKLNAELVNPNSQFRANHNHAWENYASDPTYFPYDPMLLHTVQDASDIPVFLKRIYDPKTKTATDDLGVIDKCYYGSGYAHDHYDFENTYEEVPQIILSAPTPVSGLAELTQEQIDYMRNTEFPSGIGRAFLYSEYGYGLPYYKAPDGRVIKLADVPCREIRTTPGFVYCITAAETIIQISTDGSFCSTIYVAGNALDDLCYNSGILYFQDGEYVMQIDVTRNTSRTLLRASAIFVSSWEPGKILVSVTHGLYYQQFFFTAETGELEATRIL